MFIVHNGVRSSTTAAANVVASTTKRLRVQKETAYWDNEAAKRNAISASLRLKREIALCQENHIDISEFTIPDDLGRIFSGNPDISDDEVCNISNACFFCFYNILIREKTNTLVNWLTNHNT